MKKSVKGLAFAIAVLMCGSFGLTAGATSEASEDYDTNRLEAVIEKAAANSNIISGDFTCYISDGHITIAAYTGNDSNIVIPDTIEGYPVIAIGYSAFSGNTNLTSITIPNSITSIGDFAFKNCTNLKEVSIPDSVNFIGGSAFSQCSSLTRISIPDSVTSIKEQTFYFCTNLKDVIIPNSVSAIGNDAFLGCKSLENVILPDSITSIGYCAFEYCTNLKSIKIPNGVTAIRKQTFNDCSSLKSITLPDSVTDIGHYAFMGCTNLADIVIPDSVTSIGIWAFADCENLVSINIPDGISIIDEYTFSGCENLKDVIIPNSVVSIEKCSFDWCKSLGSIIIPDSVNSINDYAFYSCDSLTDVYYTGTESEWNNITIGIYNEDLLNAAIHFNSSSDKIPEITDPVESFVNRLYTILLGRNAEPDGLADWTNRLKSGTATSAEIVSGIACSQEFASFGLSNEEIVERMYQAMLDRPSDAAGKASWVNGLNSGMTINGIINGFSGSQEFGQICEGYGIKAGSVSNLDPRDKNFGLTSFTSRMYTKALDRTFDVAGLNDWTNRYLTGEAEISDIAYGFIFSPEFVNKNLSDSDYVDTLYRTFFNREPDEGGKENWMAQLADGTPREEVLDGFVGSQECKNLVDSFGI